MRHQGQTFFSLASLSEERSHSACGVGLLVNFKPVRESHQLLVEGLKILESLAYRAGFNRVTEESDGAGIRVFPLPTQFFIKKIKQGEFLSQEEEKLENLLLQEKPFAVGQYFLPTALDEVKQAKAFIERNLRKEGLALLAWRDLTPAVNLHVLSTRALAKKPTLCQAILILSSETITSDLSSFNFEQALIKASIRITNQANEQQMALQVVSQSSESLVYKGMLRPQEMANFYYDLSDEDFTASAMMMHTRFATNTDPQWSNAQPCPFFLAHNGEFNSYRRNRMELKQQLETHGFASAYGDKSLSDSMQFDRDLASQMIMKSISLEEALVRLMSFPPCADFSDNIKSMLRYFRLERTPYNGPAFMLMGAGGYYISLLDSMGLRPSRLMLVKNKEGAIQQVLLSSDDCLEMPPKEAGMIIEKSHLQAGGMVMLTPSGEIFHTNTILQRVYEAYNRMDADYFQNKLQATLFPLRNSNVEKLSWQPHCFKNPSDLNRILYSAGWDREAELDGVRYMAENAKEATAAMGDDTDPLHSTGLTPPIAYFFHQLFAQVTAPPLDSIKERERFSLKTSLGATLGFEINARHIELESPLLRFDELYFLEHHAAVNAFVLETTFPVFSEKLPISSKQAGLGLKNAIINLLKSAEKKVLKMKTGILILSDRNAGRDRLLIPDLIAAAAVVKHLENKKLSHKVSIVVDSYQITGPHQAAALLAVGAKAVYARGAYLKIETLYEGDFTVKAANYRLALERCLLKTMGKMGITDVNNYINGQLIAALGIDLRANHKKLEEEPTLGNIFSGIYSPMRGINLSHIAESVVARHGLAYDSEHIFSLLPFSGDYIPQKGGIKHGYGPEVVNAFTQWMKAETLCEKRWRIHTLLEKRGHPDFVEERAIFSKEKGFLNPEAKNAEGFYPACYLEGFKCSSAFKTMLRKIDEYRKANPTSIRDFFSIKEQARELLKLSGSKTSVLQSQESLRLLLFSGSMSQGALTVTDPKTPDKIGAHETLTRAMNAIGANSASGEGGEAHHDLASPLASAQSKQIASGRFGVSAKQIVYAKEVEIKIAQGAKPGEGGELPGAKVSIRFAAQRGGLPGINFISPPPHHDIYSIEDLEQLIHDIKSVNPKVKVAVKLVASEGIGTIAVGVAKAGADIINIASHSGGTGAAQQSSIKHAGLPAELGLSDVDKALRKAKLRDLVQLRVSGGFKTAEEILIASILAADLFEFGTTAMLTLGCKMQRTCNKSCSPGVATDAHLFRGNQINTERYFVNLAAAIYDRLKELGVKHISELRGRTDLLKINDSLIEQQYDFSLLCDRSGLPTLLSEKELNEVKEKQKATLKQAKEEGLIEAISEVFAANPSAIFKSKPIPLTTHDRSFGARIAGAFVDHLEKNPCAEIIIETSGIAGQSYGFVLPKGMILKHRGTVQDGCGKSMTGGSLILSTPLSQDYKAEDNTIAGNAMCYGASGGKIFVNGRVGHRFGILLKGAQVVVEGVDDLAFEYMTSGTALILGRCGVGLCTGALGGIVFLYDKENLVQASHSVRVAASEERAAYTVGIQAMLEAHYKNTNSEKALAIMEHVDRTYFKVLIPTELDKINTLEQIVDVLETYQLRQAPITVGMQIWLEQKTLCLARDLNEQGKKEELIALLDRVKTGGFSIFSSKARKELTKLLTKQRRLLTSLIKSDVFTPPYFNDGRFKAKNRFYPKKTQSLKERLSSIQGEFDEVFLDALDHIQQYANALKYDAMGCSGCRAQSCSGDDHLETGCPSGKSINTINVILKRLGEISEDSVLNKTQWRVLRQAFEVQIQESPFIAYTGAACPAPCQDACTETIPQKETVPIPIGRKLVGEPVHIKDIEYWLFKLGRALGWFDEKKEWSPQEIFSVFGRGLEEGLAIKKKYYDPIMKEFKSPFSLVGIRPVNKELIIVGSGPAGMQIAYEALREGVRVCMYEKSDKAGGLLVDGIPAHKFDKIYLEEDFARLQAMGLVLQLNSEVVYDEKTASYRIKGYTSEKAIFDRENENQYLVFCVGSGLPKKLSINMDNVDESKLIQAVDFLKTANHVASLLKNNQSMTKEEQETLIRKNFAHRDPRGKKIVVIGGGDTAQDVVRWIARYFNYAETNSSGKLTILIRGPKATERGILDAYPDHSRAPTHENYLLATEVDFIQGQTSHLIEPTQIIGDSAGKLRIQIKKSRFKYAKQIEAHTQLKALFSDLPRELKPVVEENRSEISGVDMIICALGFQGESSIPTVQAAKKGNLARCYSVAMSANSIVEAQAMAKNSYHKEIRHAMGLTTPFRSVPYGKHFLATGLKRHADDNSFVPPTVNTAVFSW